MTVEDGMKQIRKIISQMEGSDREVYESLLCEAEGWQMRIDELDKDEDDE